LAARKAWLPYLIYSLLSLAILGLLLFPGYVLTLDMVFTSSLDFSGQLYGFQEGLPSAFAPVYALIGLASKLVPAWLLQKAILFLIFFLAGLGAHRLFSVKGIGGYFAGLLYAVNPFTYVRFLAGQWTVLAAYALIPFAIKAFLDLLERGSGKNAIKVTLLSTVVGMMSVHGLFLLFLAFVIILLVKVIRERKRPATVMPAVKYVMLSAALFLILNVYWLVPALGAAGTVAEQISRADLLVFAPQPTSSFGVVFDTASMYGFWRGGYIYAKDILSICGVLFVFILFLAVYGFISRLIAPSTQQRWVAISFVIIGVVSLLLAVGASSGFTRPPFEWAWEHVPFFRGFRDSQKFVALLCLAYAYLGGIGVSELAKGLRQQGKRLSRAGMTALIGVALLTPAVYSFTMFGFYGQLGATDYPPEWYEVNDYLNQDEDDFNVLFLPWHLYMDYNWLPNRDKRLGNPAQQFFDKPVITGDNMEVPGIYSQSTNPISKYVEFLLGNGNDVDNLGELLAPLNVKYIILVHEVDYAGYDFLYHQKDLKVELETRGLTLLENEHPVARIYAVDSVVYVESLDQYLELSEEQDVMEHLYILGSGSSSGGDSGAQRLDFTESNPAKYQVQGTTYRYTIFTVPQSVNSEHWEYDGKQPVKNLGFMPTFESAEDGGEILYTRFYRVYLPSYIISAVALIALIAAYFSRGKMARLFRRDKKVTG
jgi:hypothetical protein